MEFKSPLPSQKSLEDILRGNIELVENSNLKNITKLELVLLLLDKKQGVQIGDFKIVESEEEKKKVTDELAKELAYILQLFDSLKLKHQVVKELGDDNGIVGFSVLTSKDKDILDKFVKVDKGNDDKTFGTILGYPNTAVEAYGTDKAFNKEELPKEELEKLKTEGIIPFLLFMPSKEHWLEELEWARGNQRLIKEKAPKLYKELIWEQKRAEIDQRTDALGEKIDEGIKETVVAFNLNGIPTSQSCDGDINSHKGKYSSRKMAPWVEVYPQEPEQEGWQDNDKLREKVIEESDRYAYQVFTLLNEFYDNRKVLDDIKLTMIKIAYGFRVQSSGAESLKNPKDKNKKEKSEKYKKEMQDFTAFLKAKFFKG